MQGSSSSTTTTTTTSSDSKMNDNTKNINQVLNSVVSIDDDEDMYRREVVFKILYITKFLANGV